MNITDLQRISLCWTGQMPDRICYCCVLLSLTSGDLSLPRPAGCSIEAHGGHPHLKKYVIAKKRFTTVMVI